MTKMVVTGAADFSAASRYKKGGEVAPYSLCEHETIGELVLIVDRRSSCLSDELVNEPIPVALEYTFALDSVLRKNSIQTGLGGVRLITTVEDLNEVITNHGDLVTVQVYGRLVSFGIESNSSVSRLPVQVVRNGVVHLLFDLTHERRLRRVERWRDRDPPPTGSGSLWGCPRRSSPC